MFESSHPIRFFDDFAVPYSVGEESTRDLALPDRHPLRSCTRVHVTTAEKLGRAVYWSRFDEAPAPAPALYRYGNGFLPGRVLPDETARDWLGSSGARWTPGDAILDLDRRPAASIWTDEDGNVFLPFDPDEAVGNFLTERYATFASGAGGLSRLRPALTASYYRVRPALPRSLQIASRRVFAQLQKRSRFPRWPVETSLHDLYDLLFDICARVAGAAVPTIAPWPHGFDWALVLTHDVETRDGYERMHVLRDLERSLGYRSAWYFVAGRYTVEEDAIADLHDDGFEVGVHGLYHDGRDVSPGYVDKRLPEMQALAATWKATGFRAPALQRDSETMSSLGFDYDSSFPDTDPYGPQAGGCCGWLPYFNRDVVELPVTLPQDHTLFVILKRDAEQPWLDKVRYLRERNGMALLLTHPDYMLGPEHMGAYRRVLEEFLHDDTVWRALPRDVSAWWRRRRDSHLTRENGDWTVRGPAAAEARVELVGRAS
jgi:peptidoglycan/xylan/chitin deacetylase (PgdA/CDA1 family)